MRNSRPVAEGVPHPGQRKQSDAYLTNSSRRFGFSVHSVVFLFVLALAAPPVQAKDTFSIDYIVTISKTHPQIADVRWELSGVEEVKYMRLRFPAARLDGFGGTGTLQPIPGGLQWTPGGP